MDFSAACAIADAVLYEGYLLYPYTASANKNRMRWQFGVVVPLAHEAARTGEHGHQRTEVLFEATAEARLELRFRFLQVRERRVEAFADGAFVPVASLDVDAAQYLTFDESLERDVVTYYRPADGAASSNEFSFDGELQIEELRTKSGELAGRVVRECWPLTGVMRVSSLPATSEAGTLQLCARAENHSAIVPAAQRGVVLRTAFVSAHTLLGIDGGSFLSPIDPPEVALAATARLVNEQTWPVLIGDAAGDAQRAPLVLSSPIVLADFPQIAKQTEADAFDGTEIDELLTLSVLSLSDAERAEARATDPRARAIVERAEAFGAADIARLHAEFEPVPTFEALTEAAPETVVVGGIVVSKGSSVRLAPKRRADAWDMFLAGKIATVQAIHQDFDDRLYVAVTVDEDPATEYHQWYGRSFFFETDEVVALGEPV